MAVTEQDWLQAQYSVLGAALIEPTVTPRVLTETSVQDYSGPCQAVYTAMQKLFSAGKPTDVVAVADMLDGLYNSFLAQLMDITPSAANVDHYIGSCKAQAKVLAIRNLAGSLASVGSVDQAQKVLDQANAIMAQKHGIRVVTMRDALNKFAERAVKPKSYLTWPIPELNSRLYVEPGDFVILGGYPSAGKSALAIQCAVHWAKNKRVGFYSLETGDEKLFDRQMSMQVGLAMDKIKNNQLTEQDWEAYAAASGHIAELPLELVPAAGMTVMDIRATALYRRHEIIIIDYLQLIQSTGSSRYEQVTNISLGLHTMAQSMGVTVVALSQLARAGRESGSPTMASLRESGQIEQDADLILLLYLEDQDKMDGPRIMRIAKNKEGTCPSIKLDFDGQRQIFCKASGDTAAKYSSMGRKAKRQSSKKPDAEQMSYDMLPSDTPLPDGWDAK